MAREKNNDDSPERYTTDPRPDLPSANVTVEYPTPVIDTKLIEIRNREAREQAERIAASRHTGR